MGSRRYLDISYLNIGPSLMLTFALLVCLILAGNVVVIFQFRIMGHNTEQLTGANRQVIAVLRLQQHLLSLHQRLTTLVETNNAEEVANGIEPMRRALLDHIQQTRSTLMSLPKGTRVDPALLPTLDAISIDLASQLDAIRGLAHYNAWDTIRDRSSNMMLVMEQQIELLVESIDKEADKELAATEQNTRALQARVLIIVPLMAISTFAIAAFFAWKITRKMLEVRQQERMSERLRIAGELHDNLLQAVISAKMLVHLTLDKMPPNAEGSAILTRVTEMMGGVVDEGRNTIQGFRLHYPGDQELSVALSKLQKQLKLGTEMECRVELKGSPRSLVPIVRNEVYAIAREALSNAFRHSRGKRIRIGLEYGPDLLMTVEDDGCGIEKHVLQHGRDGHFGLAGMRERAISIGAKVRTKSRASEGTLVELAVPGRVAYAAREGRLKRFYWRKAKPEVN